MVGRTRNSFAVSVALLWPAGPHDNNFLVRASILYVCGLALNKSAGICCSFVGIEEGVAVDECLVAVLRGPDYQ